MTQQPVEPNGKQACDYGEVLADVATLIGEARRSAVRAVNASMTALYWLIGRRIVECDQTGEARAEYGTELLARLATDLKSRFGRGFSRRNLLDSGCIDKIIRREEAFHVGTIGSFVIFLI